MIDGPGLRSVGLSTAAGLSETFADISGLAEGCRFTDCGHTAERGCAVLTALETGDLDPRRLESYRALISEGFRQAARRDARLRREAGRRHRIRHQAPGHRGYPEPPGRGVL